MDDDINNDPDLEEDSIDPFNSDESEIDDSGPEDDPPVQRMVDLLLYLIILKSILLDKKCFFYSKFNVLKTFQRKHICIMDESRNKTNIC